MPPATNSAKAVEAPTPTAPLPAATGAGSDHGSTCSGQARQVYGALVRSMLRINSLVRDGENGHHRYRYLKSETMIAEGRAALAAEGLALVPVHCAIGATDGTQFLELTFLLAHASGESVTLTRQWPWAAGAGRPADKAVAACDTTALAYLIRDLLLVDKVDEEVDDRDDREHRPPPKKTPTAAELLADIRSRIVGAPFAPAVERDLVAAGVDVSRLQAIRAQVLAA